jgi:hypothetical protein
MLPSKLVAGFSVLILGLGCAEAQTLDTTSFVVLGEGFAAGMANFGLSSIGQNASFPALLAGQMNTGFELPLIQPPGIGDVVGYPGQEVRLQTYPQGSVRQFYSMPNTQATAPPLFVQNLSVPGLMLADSVSMLPSLPIAQRDMKQTVFNMILGFPQLFIPNVPLWTQLQYAEALNPTMALIELGYYESLSAAFAGDPTLLPAPATFGTTYGNVVAGLRSLQAQVIVTTIPNPFDTAGFVSITSAAQTLQAVPLILTSAYQLGPGDYVTRNGLLAISNQLVSGEFSALPAGSTVSAATASAITSGINALNAQIVSAAQANGAVVYDLNAFLHNVKVNGAPVGSSTITADFLGGFYSMDGIYPSPTGHALIANDILTFLNNKYRKSFSLVNVSTVAGSDPLTQLQRPAGELHTPESLRRPKRGEALLSRH